MSDKPPILLMLTRTHGLSGQASSAKKRPSQKIPGLKIKMARSSIRRIGGLSLMSMDLRCVLPPLLHRFIKRNHASKPIMPRPIDPVAIANQFF